jgi:hypothetical protein
VFIFTKDCDEEDEEESAPASVSSLNMKRKQDEHESQSQLQQITPAPETFSRYHFSVGFHGCSVLNSIGSFRHCALRECATANIGTCKISIDSHEDTGFKGDSSRQRHDTFNRAVL